MISSTEQRALDLIDDVELIGWVQALTRIPSVWKPDEGTGEEAAARWVEARCHEIGLDTHFEFVTSGRPNVIAVLNREVHESHQENKLEESLRALRVLRGEKKTLMFEGHTDVVTEGDPAQWTDPPFSATIRNGRIYGRGANDMKAGLCCALMAVKAIKGSGVQLSGDILLGAVCDEEGNMIGIKHFAERGWADHVTAAIICEPEENHLCIEQKGVMWIRCVIRGVMSHGAMPLTGVNTMYPMARFLTQVQALEEREIVRLATPPPTPPALREGSRLGQPSITPTIVRSPARAEGEPQNNVMPGAAECVLDIRLIPGQNPDDLARRIEQILAASVAIDDRLRYEFEVIEVRHPTRTDRDHPVVQSLASAFTDLTHEPPTYGAVPGSTDGTILSARKGIPIITCGPGDIHIPHHVDEWVSIEEIKLAARMYVLAALRYLGA